ncbi:MAG: glycosyltransferase family 4 protein, partial [Chloroflexi bacterium]|nr:glycosyltransferase family 4 protein [Chloroflexota bacterium]
RVNVHAMADVRGAGLKAGNFNPAAWLRIYRAIINTRPDIVHFTGPHLSNPLLMIALRRAGVPLVHTLHDLDPHSGAGYGKLLYVWNNAIKRLADQILVHGQQYRARLIADGLPADRVLSVPLLHLCLSHEHEAGLRDQFVTRLPAADTTAPFALFFARLEAYKGVGVLIEALRRPGAHSTARAVIAGQGDATAFTAAPLPANVEVRNRLIDDAEAIELFSRCSVVVLPYLDATQSALIAAAYFFGKPVIVTRTGALPEYVVEGATGWVIEPDQVDELAQCLSAALSDPANLKRLGQAGREWYLAQRRLERRNLRLMYESIYLRSTAGSQSVGLDQGGRYVNDR